MDIIGSKVLTKCGVKRSKNNEKQSQLDLGDKLDKPIISTIKCDRDELIFSAEKRGSI